MAAPDLVRPGYPTGLGARGPNQTVARRRCVWGRLGMGALMAAYVIAWGVGGLLVSGPTDLDVFFVPAARIALMGAPLKVYSPRYGGIWPNANGPLSLIPLTGVAAIARVLGWLDDPARLHLLVMSAFAIFSLLLAWEGVAAVDRLRGSPVPGIWRVLTFGVFTLSPVLWHGVLFYGHIELPIAFWLTLFSVRALAEGRPARAGLGLGLGILTRSMVVIYLIALVVFLLVRWRWRAALVLAAVAVASAGLGLLPFYLADKSDLLYSLVVFRGQLLVGGGSIWGLFLGTPLEALGQHADSIFILAAVALVSAGVGLARRDLSPAGRDLYGLLALCGLCFPLLIKTLWPYYFLDPYLFIAIWWLGQAGGWRRPARWLGAALLVFFVACEGLAEADAEVTTDTVLRLHLTQSITAAVLTFMLVFGGWLVIARRGKLGTTARTAAPADTAATASVG